MDLARAACSGGRLPTAGNMPSSLKSWRTHLAAPVLDEQIDHQRGAQRGARQRCRRRVRGRRRRRQRLPQQREPAAGPAVAGQVVRAGRLVVQQPCLQGKVDNVVVPCGAVCGQVRLHNKAERRIAV